jgi:isopenicillin-N epimerase
MTEQLPRPSALASHWGLDPQTVYLNHGSFGATPTRVLGAQHAWRARLEQDAVRFFVEDHERVMDDARRALGEFLRCPWDCLALVPNATQAVATVFHHLRDTGFLGAGDEVLIPDHEYLACRHNAAAVAKLAGASVVTAPVPFPLPREAQQAEGMVVEAIASRVSARTKAVLLSHVTSPTGLMLPVEKIIARVRALAHRQCRIMVDGAHGIGFVPGLDMTTVGADYYTSNCHKWLCSPKGSAFLHVKPELRAGLRPMALSNLADTPKAGRAHFLTEFDYLGTTDCTAMYVIPEAIQTMALMMPKAGSVQDAWEQIIAHNRALCARGREMLCTALGLTPTAPDAMVGSICTMVLPEAPERGRATAYGDALQDALLTRWKIQVPVWNWRFRERDGTPGRSARLFRISAQLYNSEEQYAYLARALREELARE